MSGRKATALPILTTPADGDIIYIVDVSDTSESAQGTSKQIAKSDLIPTPFELPYKTYVALISQTGTNAPTAVVLENTLGVTITFTRPTTGDYKILFSPDLPSENILTLATSGGSTYNDCFVVFHDVGVNGLYFSNYGNGGGLQDDFTNMSIEIRVYP